MRTRDATLEDLASIVGIYNSIIPGRTVSADTEPVSVEQRLPWFYEHDPARRLIRVAELTWHRKYQRSQRSTGTKQPEYAVHYLAMVYPLFRNSPQAG
jgi:hypothetical protein